METANLLKSIENLKRHGDAVRIAKAVNAKREKRGEERISPQYVNAMLLGNRTITDEVKQIAEKYYKAQEELNKMLMV